MFAHFDSAHAALRNGEQAHASMEYKAFLAEAIHRMANARAHLGDWNQAEQNFQEALSLADDDPVMQLDYASFLFDQERFADVQSIARSVLDLHPDNVRAEILLGRVNFEQKQYSEAARFFSAAAGQGHLRDVWSLLALSYLRTRQVNLAQPLLEKSLQMLGDGAQNRVVIATVYYYGDYADLAIKQLREALALDASVPDAHYYLGLAYMANNETAGYPQAVREFELQLKTSPHDFRSQYMLGYIALQQHEMKPAEQELLQAQRNNPDDEGTRLLLAQVYSETGRTAQATDVLRSLTSTPAHSREMNFITIRAHYMLGRLLQQTGQTQEGSDEIEIAEHLRRELRAGTAETYSRNSMLPLQPPNGVSQRDHTDADISPDDRARATEFVNHLAPLVGEAYYNLARIAAFHEDQTTASRYSARAAEWDPSLASQAGH